MKQSRQKLPLHNMIQIVKGKLDLYKLSYVLYKDYDIVQCVKHDLAIWEIAQILGGN